MARFTINGERVDVDAHPDTPLLWVVREHLKLTGTHVGCDTSQCGACTVHIDGRAIKSCTMLAVQADGADVTTIEGIANEDGSLHPMQFAFQDNHGLQCGFCTPGMVMMAIDIANRHKTPDADTVRFELDGNLCRCTGYHNIVKAVVDGAKAMNQG